jgi:excisionase family DNA binding protein
MASKVLLSVQEVAEATGLDVKTVRSSIERGEIPGQRFGRLIKVPSWWVERQRSGPVAA